MANRISLSQAAFGDGDYSDGEVKKLTVGSPLWNALHDEIWINCSPTTRQEYLEKLHQPLYFAGTIVSVVRQQIELTVVPYNAAGTGPGCLEEIAISLTDVNRFL